MFQKIGVFFLVFQIFFVKDYGLNYGFNFNRNLSKVERPLKQQMTEIESQWLETGLKFDDVKILFTKESCFINKKYFLACMNAYEYMASKYNYSIQDNGDLRKKQPSNSFSRERTEKEKMNRWSLIYDKNNTLLKERKLEKLAKRLFIPFLNTPLEAYYSAQIFNHFMSIYKDPHTYIIPKNYYEKTIAQSQHQMTSYGFTASLKNDKYIVTRTYSNSVFEQAGVQKGDILLSIDDVLLKDKSYEEVNHLLNNKNSNTFLLQRANRRFQLFLTKRNQILSSVKSQIISSNRDDKRKYLELSIFKIAEGVCEKTKTQIQRAIDSGVQGVILDLRDNSGGSMDEVLCLSGLFLGDKKIYDLKFFSQNEIKESYTAKTSQVYFGPLSVIINQGTASSAEILAGVLQYYQRAYLLGENTFGKGTFQEGDVWFKNQKILLFQTKGTFYLPSGESPQLVGISPDFKINSLIGANDREKDLYYFPIVAKSDSVQNASSATISKLIKATVDKECFEKSDSYSTNDVMLGRAKELLECQNRKVVGANYETSR